MPTSAVAAVERRALVAADDAARRAAALVDEVHERCGGSTRGGRAGDVLHDAEPRCVDTQLQEQRARCRRTCRGARAPGRRGARTLARVAEADESSRSVRLCGRRREPCLRAGRARARGAHGCRDRLPRRSSQWWRPTASTNATCRSTSTDHLPERTTVRSRDRTRARDREEDDDLFGRIAADLLNDPHPERLPDGGHSGSGARKDATRWRAPPQWRRFDGRRLDGCRRRGSRCSTRRHRPAVRADHVTPPANASGSLRSLASSRGGAGDSSRDRHVSATGDHHRVPMRMLRSDLSIGTRGWWDYHGDRGRRRGRRESVRSSSTSASFVTPSPTSSDSPTTRT